MTAGIADNDLARFVLQSRSLHYLIFLPFMPRHELNSERIMGKVQRVLQSNKQVDLQDGMQVHVVHVTMPQGGWALCKRKEYGFKLSKLLGSKRSVLHIKKEDSPCLICTYTIQQGCTLQGILAQNLHKKAGVPEAFCGLPEVSSG